MFIKIEPVRTPYIISNAENSYSRQILAEYSGKMMNRNSVEHQKIKLNQNTHEQLEF
jgi:hypothetical protein